MGFHVIALGNPEPTPGCDCPHCALLRQAQARSSMLDHESRMRIGWLSTQQRAKLIAEAAFRKAERIRAGALN